MRIVKLAVQDKILCGNPVGNEMTAICIPWLLVMRSEQGHSIRGLRPLLRLVMLLRNICGMKDAW